MDITSNTIRRCIRCIVPNSRKSKKDKNVNEDKLINEIRDTYFKSIFKEKASEFKNEKSLMKAIEASADTYFNNLELHIRYNFKKYQKRYLLCKLSKFMQNCSKYDIKFMLYAIQQKINGNVNYEYKKEASKQKYDKLSNKYNINQFIDNERSILTNIIKFEIDNDDQLASVSKSEIFSYLRYFYHMLNELMINNKRSFSIVPHFVPKIRYIRFDYRALCPLYNKWKGSKLTIAKFKKKFKEYLNEMFSINTKYKKILKKYPTVRSISTNGYCVSIGFQKIKTVTYIKKNKNEKNSKKKKSIKVKSDKKSELLDLENEYNKLIDKSNSLEYFNYPLIFDAHKIKTTNEFLNNFNIGGADPGNQKMLVISMENGLNISIDKHYYYDLSHINRNKKLLDTKIKQYDMEKIYAEMSKNTPKTTKIDDYMKYVNIVMKNWNIIWEFNTRKPILALQFDTYIHKNKAITRIAKEIIQNIRDRRNVYNKYREYFDEDKFNEYNGKPILLAIGTGNGRTTISNTKHSTPKGAVNKLIKELGKYCVVILVPEHNTSQLCCQCNEYLEDVYTYKYPNANEIEEINKFPNAHELQETDFLKCFNGIKKKTTIENKNKVHKLKKKLSINKSKNKFLITKQEKESLNMSEKIEEALKEEIEIIEEMTKKIGYYGPSYRLRRCSTKHKGTNRCILWERNINAAKNMIKMMKNLLLTQSIGSFKKDKKKDGKKDIKGKKIILDNKNLDIKRVYY